MVENDWTYITPIPNSLTSDYVDATLEMRRRVCSTDCAMLLQWIPRQTIRGGSGSRVLDVVDSDNVRLVQSYAVSFSMVAAEWK